MTENDDDFEKRLRAVLARADKAAVPPLTPERLAALRELLPASRPSRPSLALLWKRLRNDARDALVMVTMTGLTGGGDSMPLFRDGDSGETHIDTVAFPLRDGELRVQVIPCDNHRAKALLSVKGLVAERKDLSVELALGERLIEARPLEQKAEVTLDGAGCFRISLFSGETPLGSMDVDIRIVKESGHA